MRLNDRLHHDLSQSSSNCPIVGGGGGINNCDGQQKNIRSRVNPLLIHDGGPNTHSHHLHEYAFDNPYFKDDHLTINDRLSNQSLVASASPLSHLNQHDENNRQQHPNIMGGGNGGDGHHHHHHFHEHISDLHQVQLSSSVNELTINGAQLGGVQLTAVDLTADGSGGKSTLRRGQEGDLIAVDITGHDFIGLGFDVTGNERDGIFVRSVLSRGPAHDSECIEAGDRIKGLTISFDNIFLQDAIDILNCGAPYKLRMLLEKQAAILVPNVKQLHGTNSNVTTVDNPAKNYLKKITNLCSPINPFKHNETTSTTSQLSLDMADQKDTMITGNKKYVINIDNNQLTKNNQNFANRDSHESHDQLSNILGSVSARRARSLNSSSAFIDYDDHADMIIGRQQQQQQQQDVQITKSDINQNRFIDANEGHQQIVQQQQQQQFNDDDDDSSLPFQRNDSHHLHGPSHRRATVAQTTNLQTIGTSVDKFDRPFGPDTVTICDKNTMDAGQTRSQPTIAISRRDSDLGSGHNNNNNNKEKKRFQTQSFGSSTVAVSTPAMNFMPDQQQGSMTSDVHRDDKLNKIDNNLTNQHRQNSSSINNNNKAFITTLGDRFSSIEEISFEENDNDNGKGSRKNNDRLPISDVVDMINDGVACRRISEKEEDSKSNRNNQKQDNIRAMSADSTESSAIADNQYHHQQHQQHQQQQHQQQQQQQQQYRAHRRLKSTGGNLGITLDPPAAAAAAPKTDSKNGRILSKLQEYSEQDSGVPEVTQNLNRDITDARADQATTHPSRHKPTDYTAKDDRLSNSMDEQDGQENKNSSDSESGSGSSGQSKLISVSLSSSSSSSSTKTKTNQPVTALIESTSEIKRSFDHHS